MSQESVIVQNKTGYVDCHCHLLDPRLDQERDFIIQRARAQGITHFVLGGVGPEDWTQQGEQQIPGLIPSFGLHPYWLHAHSEEECEEAMNELSRRVVQVPLIGEVGLDAREAYESSLPKQKEYMIAQLELALFTKKPVCFHIVRAHNEALQILELYGEGQVRGFVHAFNSSQEIMHSYLQLGLSISIGAAICWEKNNKLLQAVAALPMDRLLVESDSPDQPPPGQTQTEPTVIWSIAERIAQIKNLTSEEILLQSQKNMEKILGLQFY